MRTFVLSAFVLLLSGLDSTLSFAQKQKIDVYLIGGQSHATSQGYLKNLQRF